MELCRENLGQCGTPESCFERCRGEWRGGSGSCDESGGCNCYYNCDAKPGPRHTRRNCTGAAGPCSNQCFNACCNSKCGERYNRGIGFCRSFTGTPIYVCTCPYVC